MESAIIELSIHDAKNENSLSNMRTKLMRQIKDSRETGDQVAQDGVKPMPTNYIQPNETGYPGLEAPVG